MAIGGGDIPLGGGGARLLALTDAERRRLAAVVRQVSAPGVGGSGRTDPAGAAFSFVRVIGPAEPSGLFPALVESPNQDGTWNNLGECRVLSSAGSRAIARFAGPTADNSYGVWVPDDAVGFYNPSNPSEDFPDGLDAVTWTCLTAVSGNGCKTTFSQTRYTLVGPRLSLFAESMIPVTVTIPVSTVTILEPDGTGTVSMTDCTNGTVTIGRTARTVCQINCCA